jgi:hypothetical protein
MKNSGRRILQHSQLSAGEVLRFNHIEQMKKALGIAGVISSDSAWSRKGGDEDGTRIDLLIHRNDNAVNMCENF